MSSREHKELLQAVEWGKRRGLLAQAAANRIARPTRLTWKEISARTGYSVPMCWAVYRGVRKNPLIEDALAALNAVQPMPKIYSPRSKAA